MNKYSKKSKYGSRKVTTADGGFDSVKEYNRFKELALLERAGLISNLQRQVKYELIPTQRINGKVVERPVAYIADFTPEYIIKRKLMLSVHGIRITEI